MSATKKKVLHKERSVWMNTVSLMEDEEDKMNASYSKFGYNDDHICDAWKDLYSILNFIPALSTEMSNL